MADPLTPNGIFTLPTVGQDRDSWGDLTNANWTTADARLADLKKAADDGSNFNQYILNIVRAYLEPIGSLKMWPANWQPGGWLSCDGSALSRTDYPDLFNVLGTIWGAGDGSSTFNLPDLRGMAVVHRGGFMPFGGRLGEAAHVLSQDEMPGHNHTGWTDPIGDHVHSYTATRLGGPANVQGGFSGGLQDVGGQTDGAGNHSHTFSTDYRGANYGHNNVQPSVGLNIIIKCVIVF